MDLSPVNRAVASAVPDTRRPLIEVTDLSLFYGRKQALERVSFSLFPNEILAFIGPSGCGKTSTLKCLNRMHDDTAGARVEGQIIMNGQDIYGRRIDPPLHRRRFGWVAQKPNPFPDTIWENVAYPARLHGLTRGQDSLDHHVETCLRQAHLWEEVKDVMHRQYGTELSGGQQQRLCIARALSTQPEVMLMDEPTGSIDLIATAKVEELMLQLRETLSIVVVTHSMAEAARLADHVAFFHDGRLLEIDTTEMIFTNAQRSEARAFVEGING